MSKVSNVLLPLLAKFEQNRDFNSTSKMRFLSIVFVVTISFIAHSSGCTAAEEFKRNLIIPDVIDKIPMSKLEVRMYVCK